MVLAFAVHVLLTLQDPVAAQPVREVTSQAYLFGRQPIPAFYQGYVLFVDEGRRNLIRVYAPDGQLRFERYIQEQTPTSARGMAVDTDGTVAISWGGFDSSGKRRAGIDFLDRNGNQIASMNTAYYLAWHLAFDESHVLWSFGWERDAHDPERAAQDYMAVRKYANRREVAAFLPRSLFPHGLQPACLSWQEPGITIARDRIGLLACSGATSGNPEWVELGLDGKLIGRWRLEGPTKRVAFTKDGHLYAQETNTEEHRLFTLDRAASLKQIQNSIPGSLYGADGDDLVFLESWKTGPMHFTWFKQPDGASSIAIR